MKYITYEQKSKHVFEVSTIESQKKLCLFRDKIKNIQNNPVLWQEDCLPKIIIYTLEMKGVNNVILGEYL